MGDLYQGASSTSYKLTGLSVAANVYDLHQFKSI